MFSDSCQELLGYTTSKWGVPASERWATLCSSLRQYEPPSRSLVVAKERKWELVSAFQKSVRRGDKSMALRLVSAMDNMPEDYAYFWRRLCVTACEDVGPADDVLTTFVIACSTVFTPKKTGEKNYDIICFLAAQMCDLSTRSRVYCSLSLVEPAIVKSDLPELSAEDAAIVSAIMGRREEIQAARTRWHEWLRNNVWRAEGMLKFVGLKLPLEMTTVQASVPPYKMLLDLPSYCYDVHTRTGLAMLRRIRQGVDGAEGISEFFRQNPVPHPQEALGWALFFAEGSRIKGELRYPAVCRLEQRVVARQILLPDDGFLHLQSLVEQAQRAGVIDRVRAEILNQFYGHGTSPVVLRETEATMPKPDEDMFPDPEPGDEDDPEYKEELFNTMKAMGWKPEDLTNNPQGAEEYREWLKKQGEDEDRG